MVWPSWLSYCLLMGWTKEATAENKRDNNKRRWCEERRRYGSDSVGGAPGEKRAKRLCHGIGPGINIGPYTITRGRGWRRGRDKNKPPGAPLITAESQDANMTTMTIVMVNFL